MAPLNKIGRSSMAHNLIENGYRIEVTSEPPAKGEVGWKGVAKAWPTEAEPHVTPITTIARHGSGEDAERIALTMLRDRIMGNHVAE